MRRHLGWAIVFLLMTGGIARGAKTPASETPTPSLEKQMSQSQPSIGPRGAFLFAGTRYEGDNSEKGIPKMWEEQFLPRLSELEPLRASDGLYGIARVWTGGTPGAFEYLAAMPVKSLEKLPEGMVGWTIPARTYAVLPVQGIANIMQVDRAFNDWLATSSYVSDGDYMMEYYPPEFHDELLYLYFPIKLKQTGAQKPYPSRAVLEGVPKIGYGIHLCPFPGSVYALMQYVKDPCDYDYIMGVSGAAFRRVWNRDDGGNVDLSYYGDEPFQAVFEALGYEHRLVPPTDKMALVSALKECIARATPVLAFGIIGPPECGLVTGYDKDGEVLFGYSYFQDAKLPGYYEQTEWFEKAMWPRESKHGFIVLGEKKTKPNERAVLISSLARAIRFERMEKLDADHSAGLAAYNGWANGLEVDADYPPDDAKVLSTRVMVHGDQCVMLEERRNAATFLRRMAKGAPEAVTELNAAAELYDQTADQGKVLWPWPMELGMEVGQQLADPALRKTMAQAVRTAQEKETQAVLQLEAAYQILNAAP